MILLLLLPYCEFAALCLYGFVVLVLGGPVLKSAKKVSLNAIFELYHVYIR